MARISSAISDELLEKCQITLKQQGKTGEISRRLQAIISAKYHNISKVASIFGMTRVTMMRWIKDFDKESIGGLVVRKGRERKRKGKLTAFAAVDALTPSFNSTCPDTLC